MNAKQILLVLAAAGALTFVRAAYGEAYTMTWLETGFLNPQDVADGIVVDSNDQIYVAGRSWPIIGGSGVASIGLLAKYNPDGTREWLVPAYADLGTDQPSGIAIDSSSNVYMAGNTYRYAGGSANAFLVKFDSGGNRLWERHAGLPDPANTIGSDVAVDVVGNVYLAGFTNGKLVATSTSHSSDGFIIKYAADGSEKWRTQFGDSLGDFLNTISVDSSQNIFVAGPRGSADTYIANSMRTETLYGESHRICQ
jgi:hypothetical protein